MIVLGKTADDKGAQLEAVVAATLTMQGYEDVTGNLIEAGGNELDVVAVRASPLFGAVQRTPVVCEAKAYRDPVGTPAWQRFLGKLFIARASDASTVGVLIALNGVNGNVEGSFRDLRKADTSVFVITGRHLEENARGTGEVGDAATVQATAEERYSRVATTTELAYYGGAYYWLITWQSTVGEYSITDGHGGALPQEVVEDLNPALTAAVSGALLTDADVAERDAETHLERLRLMNRLFAGKSVEPGMAAEELGMEPFCAVIDGQITLRPAGDLDANAVSRLFVSIFAHAIPVAQLGFAADRHHTAYVLRLIDVLPELQFGFKLSADDDATLRAVAPYFPSVWATLAKPLPFFAGHADTVVDDAKTEDLSVVDRNAFWETIADRIRGDFVNVGVRGFLFEHLEVAELAEQHLLTVKTRTAAVGTVEVQYRNALATLSDELVGEAGTRHIVIRMLPGYKEPWETEHPEPTIALDRPMG
jgi:hypothetical protein